MSTYMYLRKHHPTKQNEENLEPREVAKPDMVARYVFLNFENVIYCEQINHLSTESQK